MGELKTKTNINKKQEKRMMSINIPEKNYLAFSKINKEKGVSNTAVLNLYIDEYIKAN